MEEQLDRELTSVFTVTPENRFCLTCPKDDCKGACKEFKANSKRLREEYSKQRKTANKPKKMPWNR